MADGYGILRSDGRWYAGTEEGAKPIFIGHTGQPATFPTEAAANLRMAGLGATEKKGRTFEVVPVTDA
jgi:hypothetical protein